MSAEESLPRPKCEKEDAHPPLAAALAGTMAVIVAIGLGIGFLIVKPSSDRATSLPGSDGVFQHGPSERTDIDDAWQSVQPPAKVNADGYAWIDRRAGIVQVPIGRAIDLVCEEQAKARPAPKPAPSSP
jgi:hypothetical protein